jgi:hypothetical protein
MRIQETKTMRTFGSASASATLLEGDKMKGQVGKKKEEKKIKKKM